jgi:putative ABC transport system ATP-binding protein
VNGTPAAEARRRAIQLLDEFDMSHRADVYPQTLSGGEQQRVALARALSNRPSLVLADEPTAALDGMRPMQVMDMLRDLSRNDGVTVCVVTHDIRSNELFDRVIEISDGSISGQARRGP